MDGSPRKYPEAAAGSSIGLDGRGAAGREALTRSPQPSLESSTDEG